MPTPMWLLIGVIVTAVFRERETRKWIMRIAEAVDKMDSDENGWCRHDPVSFVTTDPREAVGRLLKTLDRK